MHPAFSVILFTTLSGAGFGALAWLGAVLALAPRTPAPAALVLAIVVALACAAGGLVASLAHLGRPERAWRAYSQWRSSWLSREGLAATLCFAPAAALALMLWRGAPIDALAVRAAAVLTAALALVTVHCTARIYTSLKPIAAWADPWVLPGYFGFALWSGALLLLALGALVAPVVALVLTLAVGAAKLGYWRSIDAAPSALTTADAVGLPEIGTVRSFEAPHTEANYLLREMGYRVARKHASALRRVFFAALAGVAIALAAVLAFPPARAPCAAIALVFAAIALGVERWLFFAQARHVVTLYYGERGR